MDSYKNPKLIDRFTFLHFLSGIIAYIVAEYVFKVDFDTGFAWWNFLHLLYECKDFYNTYLTKTRIPRGSSFLFHSDNSWPNSIFDLIAGALGFLTAYEIKKKYKQKQSKWRDHQKEERRDIMLKN